MIVLFTVAFTAFLVCCVIFYLGLTIVAWASEEMDRCTLFEYMGRQWRFILKAAKRLW
jgi:lipopolysaccharide export LptBFGC system permease protein LptF